MSARPESPSDFDFISSDIQDSDILRIGEELQHVNLSTAVADGSFPARGLIYGSNHCVFVPLTVRTQTPSGAGHFKWVLFLINTRSPHTFLRSDTYEQLGYGNLIPASTNVLIHGVSVDVAPCHGGFSNANLLGVHYLKHAAVKAGFDYSSGEVLLTTA